LQGKKPNLEKKLKGKGDEWEGRRKGGKGSKVGGRTRPSHKGRANLLRMQEGRATAAEKGKRKIEVPKKKKLGRGKSFQGKGEKLKDRSDVMPAGGKKERRHGGQTVDASGIKKNGKETCRRGPLAPY